MHFVLQIFLYSFHNIKIVKQNYLALAGIAVQIVAGIAVEGIGKRDAKDFWTDLFTSVTSTVTPIVDQAVQRMIYEYNLYVFTCQYKLILYYNLL